MSSSTSSRERKSEVFSSRNAAPAGRSSSPGSERMRVRQRVPLQMETISASRSPFVPGTATMISSISLDLTISGTSSIVPQTGMPAMRILRLRGSSSANATGWPNFSRFCWQMRAA